MKNNTINITPAPSAFGAFVPTGSYQKNCKNITVTLLCNCIQEDGSENPTVISYTAEDAAQIYDIVNENGSLGLSKGIVNPSPFSKFGAFVPAGSYQNTSSKITVVIEAQCMGPNNTYLPSMLQFNQQELDGIIDIANTNGSLSLVNCYETLSKQVTTCYLNNLTELNAVCKSAVLAGGLDPMNNFEWRNFAFAGIGSVMGFELNNVSGFNSIGLSDIDVVINNNVNDEFSGTLSFMANFGTIEGDFIQNMMGFPRSNTAPFSLPGYTIQALGTISIQINNGAFTVVSININSASTTCFNSWPTIENQEYLPSSLEWINAFKQFSLLGANESIIQKIVGVITPAILKA